MADLDRDACYSRSSLSLCRVGQCRIADIIGIVVEDAPSGIKSGVASGARVLAVCTSHTREEVEGFGATWVVNDLTK
jgi:hypothetical protein